MNSTVLLLKKNQRLCFYLLLALALISRIAWVSIAGKVDPVLKGDPLYGDASGYHLLALNLNSGLGFSWDGTTPTFYRMPGYPVFLSLVYRLAGTNLQVVRFIQAIVGGLLCIPIWVLSKKIAGFEFAVLATLIHAVFPLSIYMTGWLYTETIFMTTLYFFLYLFISTLLNETRYQLGVLLSGVLLALLTYLRCQAILLPIGIAIVMFINRPKEHIKSPWRNIKTLAFIYLVTMILLTPWIARNYTISKSIALSADMGINLWGGNNPAADGTFKPDGPFVMEGMSESESSRYYANQAVAWIWSHPGQFFRLIPKKFAAFFSPMTMTTIEANVFLSRGLNIIQGSLLLFSVVGLIFLARQKVIFNAFVGILIVQLGLTAIFFGGTRLALPVYPILLISAIFGVLKTGTLLVSLRQPGHAFGSEAIYRR